MQAKTLILATGITLGVAACSTRPTQQEIETIEVDCNNAQEQIATLEAERERTSSERLGRGVQSVAPPAVIVNIFRGQYDQNVQIASGEYEQILLDKIDEIERTCGLR